MDRNTVIGFVLIGLLMMGMFYFNSRGSQALQAEQKRVADSIAKTKPKLDTVAFRKDSLNAETIRQVQAAGEFQNSLNQPEELSVLENDVIKVTFTNKGAQPKTVEIKTFKAYDGKLVLLQNGAFNKISYTVNSGQNKTVQTGDLTFAPGIKTESPDKSQTVSFSLKDSAGKEIVHQYSLKPNNYLVDFDIVLVGADKLLTQSSMKLLWQTQAPKIEKDMLYERQQTHIGFLQDGSYDFEYLGSGDEMKFEKPVEWIAVKQQFFFNSID